MRIEIRADHILLDGYVNAAGRDSRVIPDRRGSFVEQVVPGTFTRALGRGKPVELMLNHRQTLGSTATGEVTLFEDSIGLRAQAKITNAEVIEKARKKELRGWSFGFEKPVDEWENRSDAPPRRYLKDFTLREVSIIDKNLQPAYPATSIEMRGADELVTEYRAFDDSIEYVEAVTSEASDKRDVPAQEERSIDPRTALANCRARSLRLNQR